MDGTPPHLLAERLFRQIVQEAAVEAVRRK
jgi:hypothetical protein